MKSIISATALILSVAALTSVSAQAALARTGHELEAKTEKTIGAFERKDPSIAALFEKSYGYAVFPRIAKGGAGIGAARGKGLVYEKGALIGEASIIQVTVGLELGGEVYSQVIFFENEAALTRFKQNNFEFAAHATGVAVTAGAGAQYQFDSVAVYTMARRGGMIEAAIGGQKFHFTPRAS